MNVTTFNDLFVDELYLNGLKFSVENFKGSPGEVPTVDKTLTILKETMVTTGIFCTKPLRYQRAMLELFSSPTPQPRIMLIRRFKSRRRQLLLVISLYIHTTTRPLWVSCMVPMFSRYIWLGLPTTSGLNKI